MSNFEFENRNCEFNNTINFIFHLNPNSILFFMKGSKHELCDDMKLGRSMRNVGEGATCFFFFF